MRASRPMNRCLLGAGLSEKDTASPTVVIFWASSSEMVPPNPSSNAMINSTRSSESAFRSSRNRASATTCAGSTLSLSMMISLTFSNTSDSSELLLVEGIEDLQQVLDALPDVIRTDEHSISLSRCCQSSATAGCVASRFVFDNPCFGW